MKPNVLITGGAGFIGSHFVDYLNESRLYNLFVIDSLTYAGSLGNLELSWGSITFNQLNICDRNEIDQVFKEYDFKYIVNFAAESHVDNSILNPSVFIETNIVGTQVLLDAFTRYSKGRFIQISTDEVYGSVNVGYSSEHSSLDPSSPYSASKASAELLVRAMGKTHEIDFAIVRCSNNYGPRQYKEKFIPKSILSLMNHEEVKIYGDGSNSREWIHVHDCCRAIYEVMVAGTKSETYNISSGYALTNLELAYKMLDVMGLSHQNISFVEDRKGHDVRYAMDFNKLSRQFQWLPKVDFDLGLERTIKWYSSTH